MKKILLILLLTSIAVGGGVYYFTKTRPGLKTVSKQMLPDFLPADDIEIGDFAGDMAEGIVINQIELKNLRGFPEGSFVRIQRITLRLQSLNPQAIDAEFENIRLFLPHSDPIVFSGSYRAGILEGNVYSSNISIEEILNFLPRKLPSHPRGAIKDIDLHLYGPLDKLNVRGTFLIEQLIMPRFTLRNAPGELALAFEHQPGEYAPTGYIKVNYGEVKTKNATLNLNESRIRLAGSFKEPHYDIHGTASIGRVDMTVGLSGTPQDPEWRFFSNPPLPEEVLMLMFLTGKSFESVQASADEQRFNPDLAKDMVDYFLFGGEGGRMAEGLGIKDVSVIYEEDVTGMGVTKEVTDYLDVGYQLEQETYRTEEPRLKHTLDAEKTG